MADKMQATAAAAAYYYLKKKTFIYLCRREEDSLSFQVKLLYHTHADKNNKTKAV